MVGLDGAWKNSVVGGAPHAAASRTGGAQTKSGLHKTAQTPARPWCFGPTRHLRARATISCLLSICGPTCKRARDNPVDTIFERLQEQSRLKITNEPRRSIEMDNQEAVKIGDLEQNSEAM